ncbi:MAG: peroxidase-related enzyme [Blastocatellia bacterium]|nr:peroxidase-related enzyme [Blastocatellia bacterium]
MAQVKILDPAQAPGKSKELLDALQKNIKSVPNLAKALANSPAALKAWMEFDGALAKGSLNAKLRQEIALAVGQKNGCEYCVSAHTTIGKLAGLTDQQILKSRLGQGISPKDTAALTFTRELLEKHGQVPTSSIQALRAHGFTDGEIVEIIAHVALNIYTNYFNIALDVDVDFPRVALHQLA